MMVTFVAKLLPEGSSTFDLHKWYVVDLDGDGFHIVPLDSPHRDVLNKQDDTKSGIVLSNLVDILREQGVEE